MRGGLWRRLAGNTDQRLVSVRDGLWRRLAGTGRTRETENGARQTGANMGLEKSEPRSPCTNDFAFPLKEMHLQQEMHLQLFKVQTYNLVVSRVLLPPGHQPPYPVNLLQFELDNVLDQVQWLRILLYTLL